MPEFSIPDFAQFLVLFFDDLLHPLVLYRVHLSLAKLPLAPLEAKSQGAHIRESCVYTIKT